MTFYRITKEGEGYQTVEGVVDPDSGEIDGYEGWTIGGSAEDHRLLEDVAWLRKELRFKVDLLLNATFRIGFEIEEGPLAGHILQVRDEIDRTNWLAATQLYSAAIGAGHGSESGGTIRTAANVDIAVTNLEGLEAMLALGRWSAAQMQRSWTLKNAIDEMTAEQLVELDVAAEWEASE